MGQVFILLVAVAAQRVMNSTLEIGLQDLGATQLANLLCRLADCQMACSRFAVLNLARGSKSKSLFCGFVSLQFGH